MKNILAALLCMLMVLPTAFAQNISANGNVSVSNKMTINIVTASTSAFEGYGASATGGSTPCVASNAATFTSCLSVSGRHITFSAGGTYNGTFNVLSNTFIDGFSAPSAVLITGGAGAGGILQITNGQSNIIIQGLRIRGPGPGNTKGIMLYEGSAATNHDIVIDHCEISNVSDEDIGSMAHNVTVSWNLLGGPAESGGMLVKYDAYQWSIHHNLWVNLSGNDTRTPLIWAGNDTTANFPWNGSTVGDVIANVTGPGWTYGITYQNDTTLLDQSNIIDNFQADPDVTPDHCKNALVILPNNKEKHYLAGNANTCNPVDLAGTAAYGSTFEGQSGSIPRANSNTLNCGALTGCQLSTPVVMPTITYANPLDATARIAEWNNVINTAGVISHFADDSTATTLRAKITRPTTTILNQSWNQ